MAGSKETGDDRLIVELQHQIRLLRHEVSNSNCAARMYRGMLEEERERIKRFLEVLRDTAEALEAAEKQELAQILEERIKPLLLSGRKSNNRLSPV